MKLKENVVEVEDVVEDEVEEGAGEEAEEEEEGVVALWKAGKSYSL